MHAYNPNKYQPDLLHTWIQIAERQAAKDAVLIPEIAANFCPGRVLELGSGTGHIALLLKSLGFEVVASDYAPFFVEHMQSKGLLAYQIDATDICAAGVGSFPNIFCQSITPFITDDLGVVERAYRSVFEALETGGRLVLIHAMEPRSRLVETMQAHRQICQKAGFHQVRMRRDQLLPSVAYRLSPTIAGAMETRWASSLGSRFVLCATKRE